MAPLLEEIRAEVLRRVTPSSEERRRVLELAEGLKQRVRAASEEAGRIVIPKELRKKLGWVEGTKLKVIIEGKRVILEEVT